MVSLNIIKTLLKYIQKKPISNTFNKIKDEIEKKKIFLKNIIKDRQKAITKSKAI